jgi:hypothetical protein
MKPWFAAGQLSGVWSDWSACFGHCHYGLRVRNRRVTRPPFPERTADGELTLRHCPQLYQVDFCIPSFCTSPSPPPLDPENTSSNNETSDTLWPSTRARDMAKTTVSFSWPPVSAEGDFFVFAPRATFRTLPRGATASRRVRPREAKEQMQRRPTSSAGHSMASRSLFPPLLRLNLQSPMSGCRPYSYAYCGMLEEIREAPIKFESACLDLCFSSTEKKVSSLFLPYKRRRRV